MFKVLIKNEGQVKFIKKLSQEEYKNLKNSYKKNSNHRIRERAKAIILSSRDFSINEIANIFEVDRDSVSSWIKKWEEGGIEVFPISLKVAGLRFFSTI